MKLVLQIALKFVSKSKFKHYDRMKIIMDMWNINSNYIWTDVYVVEYIVQCNDFFDQIIKSYSCDTNDMMVVHVDYNGYGYSHSSIYKDISLQPKPTQYFENDTMRIYYFKKMDNNDICWRPTCQYMSCCAQTYFCVSK